MTLTEKGLPIQLVQYDVVSFSGEMLQSIRLGYLLEVPDLVIMSIK